MKKYVTFFITIFFAINSFGQDDLTEKEIRIEFGLVADAKAMYRH